MTDRIALHRQQFWAGSLAALASAILFASNVVFSRLAYDFGANLHSLNLVRTVTFLCCLILVVFAGRTGAKMHRADMLRCFWLGVLLCAEMYLVLASIIFIPVALAILVFYSYPLMIALWAWATGKSSISPVIFGVMLVAFSGLVITLTGSDLLSAGWKGWTGVGLAVCAALGLATLLILTEQVLQRQHVHLMMLYMLFSATAIVVTISLTMVEPSWPDSGPGWLTLAASAGLYVGATLLLFRAVDLVGSLQTAIIDNTSPIWAMILGFIVLAQWLTPREVAGALVTVGAVMLLQWLRRPKSG